MIECFSTLYPTAGRVVVYIRGAHRPPWWERHFRPRTYTSSQNTSGVRTDGTVSVSRQFGATMSETYEERILQEVAATIRNVFRRYPRVQSTSTGIVPPVDDDEVDNDGPTTAKHCRTCRCFPPSFANARVAEVRPYRPDTPPETPRIVLPQGHNRPPPVNAGSDVLENEEIIVLEDDDDWHMGAEVELHRQVLREMREGDWLREANENFLADSSDEGEFTRRDVHSPPIPRPGRTSSPPPGRPVSLSDTVGPVSSRYSRTTSPSLEDRAGLRDVENNDRGRRSLKRLRGRVYRFTGGNSDSSSSDHEGFAGVRAAAGDRGRDRRIRRRSVETDGVGNSSSRPSTSTGGGLGATVPSSSRPPTTLASDEDISWTRHSTSATYTTARNRGATLPSTSHDSSRPPTTLTSSDEDDD